MSNHIWEVVYFLPCTKTIDYKYIFLKKLKPNRFVEKYKARNKRKM